MLGPIVMTQHSATVLLQNSAVSENQLCDKFISGFYFLITPNMQISFTPNFRLLTQLLNILDMGRGEGEGRGVV